VLMVEGVAVTVSESRVWNEAPPHPANKIKELHRSALHA
jgi:hypothetical protein